MNIRNENAFFLGGGLFLVVRKIGNGFGKRSRAGMGGSTRVLTTTVYRPYRDRVSQACRIVRGCRNCTEMLDESQVKQVCRTQWMKRTCHLPIV